MRLSTNSRFLFHGLFYATIALLALHTAPNASVLAQAPMVVQPQPASSGYVCPKCGRIHAQPTSVSSAPIAGNQIVTAQPVSNASIAPQSPVSQVSYRSVTGGGVQNVLSMLNGQRSRQGLRSLRYDGALQAVAERRARQMANTGTKSHPPGSFAPGRYEGVGWSSSFSPGGVYACYTSDPNMKTAGAAMVTGRDGVYFAVVYR